MAVVAIGQQIGSNGLGLGRVVAAQLQYPLLTSEEIAAEVAHEYHVTAEQLRLVDEREPRFWERLGADSTRVVAYFCAVVMKHMASCQVVIVGRSIPLMVPQTRHALRIRTVAPFRARVQQVMLDEKLRIAAAERRVRTYDLEVRARTQNTLGVDLEDPSLYDWIINTARCPLLWFASSIAEFASTIEREADANSKQALIDGCLTAQVRAALMAHPKIGHAPVTVQTQAGRVVLKSSSLVPPWDSLATSVVQQVTGVQGVQVEIEEAPVPIRVV
jgi:cytidylate kinase